VSLEKKQVFEKLKTVIDPELGVNIVDLGLIYGVEISKQNLIKIKMTLTSPGCPLAGMIDSMIREAVRVLDVKAKIKLELVWDPPWIPDMISEEAKAELGLD